MTKTKWIALLRGINVGGHNKLPMKPLCAAMERAGFGEPRSYIQSGNLVFNSTGATEDAVKSQLADLIQSEFALSPAILIRSPQAVHEAVAACPFETVQDPKTLHYFFLEQAPPAANLAKIEDLRASDEAFHLSGDMAYLYAPSGIGRSKLMAATERLLGVPTTARNLRTVQAILALCSAP